MNTNHRIALLASVAFACNASGAFAQDAAPIEASDTAEPVDDGQGATGEIIVTAQRREQRLQDVPVSVQVTTGEEVQKAGVTDLASVAARLPSVQIGTGVQSNNIRIRGVGSGLNSGFEQSVGTFVDGVYRPRSRTVQAGLFDIERLEVLNGPQTTFFGNNTIAGALNITTKKPDRDFEGEAEALYSPSDGQYIARAGVSIPLSNALAVRLAGQLYGMDGYIDNRFLQTEGPRQRDFVGRASARFDPGGVLTSDLRFDYARNRDSSTFNAEITGCPPPPGYPAARGPCLSYIGLVGGADKIDNKLDFISDVGPSSFDLDFYEGAWTNRFDFDAVSLVSLTSYSKSDTDSFINASPLPVTGVSGYFTNPFRQIEEYKLFTQELRVESTSDGPLQYVFGGYYSRGRLFSDSYASLFGNRNADGAGVNLSNVTGTGTTAGDTPIGTNRQLRQREQTRSVFGQLTFEITPDLKLAGGLRYTSVKKSATRAGRVGVGSPIALPEGASGGFQPYNPATTNPAIFALTRISNAPFADPETTYSKLMPAVSATYAISPAVTVYGSYTSGFKAGGYADGNTPNQFDSETVDSYELGLKGSFFDRRMFVTLNGFHSRFNDLQQALTLIGATGATISVVGNAATSTSQGVEFTMNFRAHDQVTINAAASYIDSKFDDYKNAACTQLQLATVGARCIQDLSGQATPFAPKFSANLGMTLTFPLSGDVDLRADPNVYYSDGYFLAPTNDPLVRQENYAVYDLRLGLGPDDRRWEFAVIGRNLANEAVKTTAASAVGTSPGLAYAVLQRARSIAFSASVKF